MLTLQQQKLQTEVLANHLHLQHKNEILQQLQTRLSDTDININQVVKEVGRVDKDFEKLNSEFRSCIRISLEVSVKKRCKDLRH